MPIRISVPAVPFRDAAANGSLFTAPVGGVAVLVALVTLGWAVRAVHSWRRLRHVPGPALARWSSLWMVKRLSSGRFHEAMCEVMEEYGEFLSPGDSFFVQPHSSHGHVGFGAPSRAVRSRAVLCSCQAGVDQLPGPLVRIGPNELTCSDPDVLRRMSAARSLYTKGEFYETGRIIPGHDNIVTQRDDAKHKALRAQMTNAVCAPPRSR